MEAQISLRRRGRLDVRLTCLKGVSMKQSIFSTEVFLTGYVTVTVLNASGQEPRSGMSVTFTACAYT